MTRRRIPLWGAALLIFAASRLWSTALLVTTFVIAKSTGTGFASQRIGTNLITFFGSWDASFYRRIATHGYPTILPTSHGHVVPNEWAFLPVFPTLVRGVMVLTGLGADAAGVVVAILAAAGASVALGRLLEPRVGRSRALWVVAAFGFGPLGFLLQLPYAEGLFCLLVFCALAALARRRYALFTVLGVIAAFTRPGELALPLALGVLLVLRLRHPEQISRGERARIIAAGVVTAGAGLAWPLIAGWVTGVPDAYLATELSWWTGFVGRPAFVPFTPWFLLAGRWLRAWGILLVIAALAGIVVWFVRRRRSELGAPIIAFGAGYALYLVAVFLPQQSLFRLLLPLTPLLGDASISQRRVVRITLLALGCAVQPVAVYLLWLRGYP